ncbi:DEAD/DEAH box helicase [Fusibacter sp. 3D3]|uniref:DEAD/DEAH box helicase n=1 Tax=Fusibacter sp. 3D3 TaxID=1048380 RepID=UPI0008530113|nr:DEAD/DEAH box helicase [Fusibacter sp. 3D3]GAU79983.1 DEAD-box ATP-dependent RNA helicase CshA [Fusibacter sp. 3D3]
MENQFSNLGITEPIVKALESMGFISPTDVQTKAIPHILNSEDLIVMSKTGSGKTGAFGIPVLQSVDNTTEGPQALILTPTRELAVQVDSDLKRMSKHLKVNTTAVYGQHNIVTEMSVIEKGVSVITGTPGRVFDHINKKTISTKNIRYLILDEADRMLDMGFIDQVVKIIKALPKDRVTMLFSATMPNEIQKICREYMKEPITIELESDTKTVDSIKQFYYRVNPDEKRTQLDRLLKLEQPDSCMVFCNTRHVVDRVNDFLLRRGYVVDSLHGANTQTSRTKTIQKFKKGELQILVATDVAARGLHIDDLTLVINYDVPSEKDSYVHRIGRTGRAGNGGRAITLVTTSEVRSLYEIEEHTGVLIDEEELPTDEAVREAVKNASGKWVGIIPTAPKSRTPHTQPHRAQSQHSDRNSSRMGNSPRPKPSTSKASSVRRASESSATVGQRSESTHKEVSSKQVHPVKQNHVNKHVEHPKHTEQVGVKKKAVVTISKPVVISSKPKAHSKPAVEVTPTPKKTFIKKIVERIKKVK